MCPILPLHIQEKGKESRPLFRLQTTMLPRLQKQKAVGLKSLAKTANAIFFLSEKKKLLAYTHLQRAIYLLLFARRVYSVSPSQSNMPPAILITSVKPMLSIYPQAEALRPPLRQTT